MSIARSSPRYNSRRRRDRNGLSPEENERVLWKAFLKPSVHPTRSSPKERVHFSPSIPQGTRARDSREWGKQGDSCVLLRRKTSVKT